MSKFSWLAIIALLGAFVVSGCGDAYEEDVDESGVSSDVDGGDDNTEDSEGDDSAAVGTEMTLADNAYTDDDGDAICPVSGDKVTNIAALDSQEYEDETFYFC